MLQLLKKLCLTAAVAMAAVGAQAAPVRAEWSSLPDAPTAVARPFAGWVKGHWYMAGGSAFDESKTMIDTISRFDLASKTWTVIGHLPKGTAEGGAVVLPSGLLCVGGITADGPTASAFVLRTDGTTLPVPDCPYGTLSMTASAAWDGGAVFIGGLLNGQPTNRVFTLKPTVSSAEMSRGSAQGASHWVWDELPPLPGPARSQAVAAAQNGDQKHRELLVFGGTVMAEDGKQMTAYDGFAYCRDFNGTWSWQKRPGAPFSTIGATLLPIGDQHLLLFGGYNGDIWDRANRMTPEDAVSLRKEAPAFFKWNRSLFAYHTVTKQWSNYGTLPEDMLPRCGAGVAVIPGTTPKLFVCGGEIKPACRTAATSVATFVRQGWRFSWVSWSVIALLFLSMVGMGGYFALKPKNADDYFRGGGRIPWYVAGVSIYATMLSSITFISIPTMTYISDWRYFTMAFCILALAPIAIYFYLPFFCRLKITSAYEYLEKRFNVGIRLFGAGVFNIFMICRVAVVTLLPAIALSAVTDMPIWFAILLCGIATILYCFYGGVEAVIWGDFVQGLILLFGALIVMVSLIISSGGPAECFAVASDAGKLRMLDFRFLFGEPVFWVVLVMGLVSNLNSYTADQCVVQRYITTPNEKAASRSIWFNGVLSLVSSVIFYLIGTALYTHYVKHADWMDITMPKSDSIFPIFMAIELHPIISGLIVASIFAATISTLSTNLNSASTSIVVDFIARFRKNATDADQVRWGRWCVAVVGVLGVAAALILSALPSRSLFDVFQNFIGTLTGGLSALFFIGIFMPRVSGGVAMVSLVVNYIVSLFVGMVFPGLHPFMYGGIALAVCIALAFVLSFIFPNRASVTGLVFASRPERKE